MLALLAILLRLALLAILLRLALLAILLRLALLAALRGSPCWRLCCGFTLLATLRRLALLTALMRLALLATLLELALLVALLRLALLAILLRLALLAVLLRLALVIAVAAAVTALLWPVELALLLTVLAGAIAPTLIARAGRSRPWSGSPGSSGRRTASRPRPRSDRPRRPPRAPAPGTCRRPGGRCRARAHRDRCYRKSGFDWAGGSDCDCAAACADCGHRHRRFRHCGRHATAADCLVSLTWASYTPDGFDFATLCPSSGAVTAQWCEGYLAVGETPAPAIPPKGLRRT